MRVSNWLKAILTGTLVASLALVAGCPPPPDNEDAGNNGTDAGVQHDAATQHDATGNDATGNDAGGPCPTQYQYTDWNVTSDRLLVKACSPYIITTEIEVGSNATLTIEAGVEVRFARDGYLRVGYGSPGKLVVNGTSNEPVVFTSSQTSPAAGAWGGIVLADETSTATVIANAHIRYAGQAINSLFEGCLTVSSPNTNRITVNNTTFEDCIRVGVSARDAEFGFAAFTNNTFTNCVVGLRVHPNAIGTIAGTQTYTGTPKNQIEDGVVAASATWAKQNVVWEAIGSVDVEGANNPVLTIPEGSVFKFASNEWLRIGYNYPGGLLVTGSPASPVVFDTIEAVPAAGSWIGLVFGGQTLASTSISYVTVKYAGRASNSQTRGCITVLSTNPGRIAINHTAVDTCAQAGVSAEDPGTTFATFANNTFKSAPMGLNINAQAIGSIDNTLTFVSTTVNHIAGDTVKATATWKKQSLPWLVDGSIDVDDVADPILTIPAGSVFKFSTGEWLRAGGSDGGGLIVAGSSTDPVIFESRESVPTRGSWIGVVLGPQTLATTSLTYATVRYAGQNTSSIVNGCLTVQSQLTGRIAVNHSTFDTCLQSAVAVNNEGFGFVTFANNTFVNSELGLLVDAQAIGSIAASQTYVSTTLNHVIGNYLVDSATWVSQPVPWIVEGSLYVADPNNSPVLTIQGPNTFRFAQNQWLQVGNGNPGGLIVSGTTSNEVIFESSQPTPAAGSWIGLFFQQYTMAGTVVDHAIVRHAGEHASSITLGGISLRDSGTTVTISNSTFSTNSQSDIFIDCLSTPTLTNNTTPLGVVRESDTGC